TGPFVCVTYTLRKVLWRTHSCVQRRRSGRRMGRSTQKTRREESVSTLARTSAYATAEQSLENEPGSNFSKWGSKLMRYGHSDPGPVVLEHAHFVEGRDSQSPRAFRWRWESVSPLPFSRS